QLQADAAAQAAEPGAALAGRLQHQPAWGRVRAVEGARGDDRGADRAEHGDPGRARPEAARGDGPQGEPADRPVPVAVDPGADAAGAGRAGGEPVLSATEVVVSGQWSVVSGQRRRRTGMTVQHYTHLIAWQKAMDLVVEVYRSSESFPKTEMFGLIN